MIDVEVWNYVAELYTWLMSGYEWLGGGTHEVISVSLRLKTSWVNPLIARNSASVVYRKAVVTSLLSSFRLGLFYRNWPCVPRKNRCGCLKKRCHWRRKSVKLMLMKWNTRYVCVCVWFAGYLRPVFGPLFLPNERRWSLRCIGRLRAPVCNADCVVSSPKSFFSSCGSCLLRMCWAVACLWLTVLLRNGRGQLSSARGIGENLVMLDAILRRTSVGSGRCVTVLVGFEVLMGKTDREGGTTVCWSANGSTRKDVEETALLIKQFGELPTSGTWEE